MTPASDLWPRHWPVTCVSVVLWEDMRRACDTDLFGLPPYQHQIGQVAAHPDGGVTGTWVPLVGEHAYSSQTISPLPQLP